MSPAEQDPEENEISEEEEEPKEETEGEEEEEEDQGSKAYFKRMGLDPGVSKNTFSVEDAIAIMEKAVSDLKERRLRADTVKRVLNQAWGIFKVLA